MGGGPKPEHRKPIPEQAQGRAGEMRAHAEAADVPGDQELDVLGQVGGEPTAEDGIDSGLGAVGGEAPSTSIAACRALTRPPA